MSVSVHASSPFPARRLSRAVGDLTYAGPCLKPRGIPAVGRPRGAKAAGLRYEEAFAKALPLAVKGQWWHFADENGFGYCQTDLFLLLPKLVVIFEVKLTETPLAIRQLSRLYIPVLEFYFNLPAVGIQVAKHLTPFSDKSLVVSDLPEALALAPKAIPTLHWLGKGYPLR